MKKLTLSIFLILICYLGFGQFPLTQNIGSSSTLVQVPANGGLLAGLIPRAFADTTAASLTNLKFYDGAIIKTLSPVALWYRYLAAQQWVQILPAGGSGGQRAWLIGGQGGIFTSPIDPQIIGVTTNQPFGLMTNNLNRVILPAAGLERQSGGAWTAMLFDTTNKTWGYGTAGSSSIPISSLTAATGTNSINNGNFQQTWSWNTLNGAFGLQLASTSTAGTSGEKVLDIVLNGAHSNNSITTTGLGISNGHTGTGSVNIGIQAAAVSGATNIAALFDRGSVNLGTVGAESGVLKIAGSTSGTITMQPQAAAGTYNWNWPQTAGTSGYLLTSAGGVGSPMTWTDPSSYGVNIYNSDGTITGDRIANGGGFILQFTNIGAFKVTDGVTNIDLDAGSVQIRSNGTLDIENTHTGASPAINIKPASGELYIDTLTNVAAQYVLHWDKTTGKVSYADTTAVSSSTWNSITSPTGDQALTFDAGESTTWTDANTTEDLFTVNSSTGTTNSMISLNRTGTALASGNNIAEFVSSGVNGTNAITATGARISVTNTNGTSGTNVGLSVTASGATTGNYGIIVPSGFVGLYQSTPTSKLQLNHDANSVTQADANGLLLANATAATVGLQSISPPLILQGNGWKTNATAGSQDVRFKIDVLPVQAAASPTGTWRVGSSINGSAYTNRLVVSSAGNGSITSDGTTLYTNQIDNTGYINAQAVINNQVQISTGSLTSLQYRTTNGGSNVTPQLFLGTPVTVTAGTLAFAQDATNSLSFTAANGTRHIARAGIAITNLVNTAASESGDLIFLTQAAGAAMAERFRISSAAITVPTDNTYDLGNSSASFKDFYTRTVKFDGSTSGTATIAAPAVAATPTLTLPIVTGTIAQYVVGTTTSSATPTPTGDARNNDYSVTALATGATFGAPSGTASDGNEINLFVKDSGGAQTLAFNAIYIGSTDIALPTTTVAGKGMLMKFKYVASMTKWLMSGLTDGF